MAFHPHSSPSTPDYLNIDDILSVSARMPCKMRQSVRKLGFIDVSSDEQHILKDTKLELPLWLAKELKDAELVSIDLPRGFSEPYREALQADSSVVNLQKIGPNFYRTGIHISNMNLPESVLIVNSLVETFYNRIRKILDYSTNCPLTTTPEMSNFIQSLDNQERKIFEISQSSVKDFRKWENRSIEKVEPNELVNKLKKRKKVAMELGDQS